MSIGPHFHAPARRHLHVRALSHAVRCAGVITALCVELRALWRVGVSLLVGAVLSLAVGLPVHAQTRITLVGEDDWYPYSADRNGQLRGLAVDLITAAYKSVGVAVDFKIMPYARCMSTVKSGHELGCFDSSRDPTLTPDYLFHDVPLFNAVIGIYARSESRETGLTAAQLSGRRVGVTNGYTYGDAVEMDKTILKDMARSDLLNLRKLIAGRTEYSVVYTRVMDHLRVAHADEFQGRFKQVGIASETGLFVTFSRSRNEAPRLAKLLDDGLRQLHKSREYERIVKRWDSPPQ